MKKTIFPAIFPFLALLAGLLILLFLYLGREPAGMELRVPGTDAPPGGISEMQADKPGLLSRGKGKPAPGTDSWSGFRGNKRDNTSLEKGYKKSFSKDEPAVLWRVKTGEGYAGAAVLNGRVYFIDYDQEKKQDAIRCLSLADGEEIWRYSYPVKVKRNHGMSRTVPAVNSKYLVTIGPMCHAVCLNSVTGELVWKKDLVKEFGSTVPPWYAGQCPLIDGEDVLLAPGGKDILIMRVGLSDGRIKWSLGNPGGYEMTHSSVMPVDFKGKKYFLYCASAGSVLVSADGKLQFADASWKINIANVPSPIQVSEELVLYTGGYDTGSKMIRLKEEGGKVGFEEVFKVKAQLFGSQQSTPAVYKGNIYGVIQAGNLACMDLKGKVLWKSGRRFGLAPFLIADDMIYIVDDMQGFLYLVEASPQGYKELGAAKIFNGHEIWAPLAVAGGRMIGKDLTEMVCFKVN